MATATVNAHSSGACTYELSPRVPFLFGRDGAEGVVGLDSRDMGISRLAGGIVLDGEQCVVRNLSQHRPICVESHHIVGEATVAPGGWFVLTTVEATLVVTGDIRRHSLLLAGIEPASADGIEVAAADSTPTTQAPGSLLTPLERDAAVAFCAPLLLPFPRRATFPNSYGEAASLLGSSPTSVRKALDRVRAKLASLDVAGFDNPSDLAHYLVSVGAVRSGDLEELRDRLPDQP